MRRACCICGSLIAGWLVAGCGSSGPDCHTFRFDGSAWRGPAANVAPGEKGSSPRQRQRDGLLKCVRLKGRTASQIEALLGPPNDKYREPDRKVVWAYDLGLIGGFDYERLYLDFGSSGRVLRVIRSIN